MSRLRRQLSMAVGSLLTIGHCASLQADTKPWEVDTSYLSYQEADDRVAVSKKLANLTRSNDTSTVTVNIVHDTMSGASPTGAIRSTDSLATYTSASGGTASANATQGDYSKSAFEDERVQLGLAVEQEQTPRRTIRFGGLVSRESDYESVAGNMGLSRESADRLTTYSMGLALTADSIYRSDTGGTPEPLGNVQNARPYSAGRRDTADMMVGVSRILNQRTVAQVNLSLGVSSGYHSDPYKIISAADDNDRIIANFHDSRPESRVRTSVFGKLVHQLNNSQDSIHLSYRLYHDDWGVWSHTGDFRYRYQLARHQYLEPHFRWYRQSSADFYQRKLAVDDGLNPVVPDDGLASADYRLDAMTGTTLGLKYGLSISRLTEFRLRAGYIDQSFRTADYKRNVASILQMSLKFKF